MKRTDNRCEGTHATSEIDLVRRSAHHASHSFLPRKRLDYWSIVLGLLCVAIGLPAFFVSAQDKAVPSKAAAEKPAAGTSTGSQVHTEKSVRLTFVEKRDLTFDRAGVLEFVHEDGETVEAGKVVARFLNVREKTALVVAQARILNNAEVVAAKKQAELAEIKAKAAQQKQDAWRAEKDLEIAKLPAGTPVPKNLAGDLYPKSTLDENWKSHEAALAEVGRYEKEFAVNEKGVEQAQADLTLTEIKAPLAGQVTRVYKRSGEGVQAGEKVLQIISTQRIRATVEVPVTVAAHLKKGMPVTVVVDQPEDGNVMKTHRYTVPLRSIDPSVIPGPQKVTIWAEIDNTEGKLREGLTSSIEIVFDNTPTAKP